MSKPSFLFSFEAKKFKYIFLISSILIFGLSFFLLSNYSFEIKKKHEISKNIDTHEEQTLQLEKDTLIKIKEENKLKTNNLNWIPIKHWKSFSLDASYFLLHYSNLQFLKRKNSYGIYYSLYVNSSDYKYTLILNQNESDNRLFNSIQIVPDNFLYSLSYSPSDVAYLENAKCVTGDLTFNLFATEKYHPKVDAIFKNILDTGSLNCLIGDKNYVFDLSKWKIYRFSEFNIY